MLTKIRDYIRQHERVTLDDIALHFNITPELAAQQISHWEVRGMVEQIQSGHSCSGCGGCRTNQRIIYAWKAVN